MDLILSTINFVVCEQALLRVSTFTTLSDPAIY